MHNNIAFFIQNKSTLLALGFICCIPFLGLSQEEEQDLGTEVVNVVKPYTPTISDAFKVKQTPVLNDSTQAVKKPVRYSIFSVPVASTFTPAKGVAQTIKKEKPPKTFDNYATLGFGNYTTILAELFSNFEISRTDNAGFYLRHNSSQNGIDDLLFDNKYFDTQLDGYYTSRQRDMTYRLDAGLEHQIFNWYGVDNDAIFTTGTTDGYSDDISQTYFSGYVGGKIAFDDSYFEKATAKIRYTGDAYGTSEINVRLQPDFSFPIADVNVNFDGDIDYLTGSFDKNYADDPGSEYSFLNAGVAPSITYVNSDLTVDIGAATYVSLDTKDSSSKLYLYPRIKASYRLIDELLAAYGGADGGLDQNTYYGYKNENPFVSPTQYITPTNRKLEVYGGLQGKLTNQIAYNLKGTYKQEDDKPLFIRNVVEDIQTTNEGYQNGNSFNVIYDNVNTIGIFGEVKVELSKKFKLGVNANFYNYSTEFQEEAWNLPSITASVFSDFSITEKLYGGASIFFTGERQENLINFNGGVNTFTLETVESYIDVNAHLGYKINERLSVFAKGANLLGTQYERWYDYPVQGIQVLGGATYKFDW